MHETTPTPKVLTGQLKLLEEFVFSGIDTVYKDEKSLNENSENRLIYGMPASTYHNFNAVNRGLLEEIRKSPAHAKAYLTQAQHATPAMEFGSAFHLYALQPDLFNSEVAIVESRPRDHAKRPSGKILITEKELPVLTQLRDALYRKEIEINSVRLTVKDLLAVSKVEQTAIWRDKDTRLLCKARFDILLEDVVIDLKTCNDAFDFGRSAYNFGYHRQAGFYLSGAKACGLKAKTFYFLVIEKDEPHGVRFFKASNDFIERGISECSDNLDAYAEAVAEDKWGDYPAEAETLELPRWA